MKVEQLFTVIGLSVVAFAGTAQAATALDMSTGFNHNSNNLYSTVAGQTDQFWVRVAASANINPQPNTTSSQYAWTTFNGGVNNPAPWLPVSGARWISVNQTGGTISSNAANPGYAIYRKCFCLAPNASNVSLNIKALRADDNVQVWLNSITNSVISPTAGNFGGGAALSANYDNQMAFVRGRKNCVYVLVEDNWIQTGGASGFAMNARVTASSGLWDTAATGLNQESYKPFSDCHCDFSGGSSAVGNPQTKQMINESDAEVVASLVKYAEQRRLTRKIDNKGGVFNVK